MSHLILQLIKLKNDSNHSLNRKLIESFLYEIIIYKDRIEVVFRRFPKGTLDYLDLENMVKDGGSRDFHFLLKFVIPKISLS